MNIEDRWNLFKERLVYDVASGLMLDTSRLMYDNAYLERMAPRMGLAFDAMEELERGGLANPDEKRMVGHYWLRSPERAPSVELREAISATIASIKTFARRVHSGEIAPKPGERFRHILVVGIGGSALGPQFVSQALSSSTDPMTISFFDNTDPDGMAKVIYGASDLATTLVIVISKSGGTKETRNGQLVAKHALDEAGLDYRRHFVAVTGAGSELDKTAVTEGWLARFPMWDWVGGRTSQCSAVGLLPMALQGFEIDLMLKGASDMDSLTRLRSIQKNPAALLALGWYHCGCGKGNKDMVVLPYKDRLELFSKYLQQLVMESLGKEYDLSGARVLQGLAVYGNKGSTDQHAYVQQLRDGVHNFFAVFIEVLEDRSPSTTAAGRAASACPERLEVEPGITSGDYLQGFYLGTRQALFEKERESITVTIPRVDEYYVGMLIALFERAVGFYASLVNVNAYHQPGVEAGKRAAAAVLELQARVIALLTSRKDNAMTVDEIADALREPPSAETIFKVLQHLTANGRVQRKFEGRLFEQRYSIG
ncbi:MAG: glucose-6-phosphate isomerase [Pseudomonadota bacterium]|jgi:glucose-6-phosphate isomerase